MSNEKDEQRQNDFKKCAEGRPACPDTCAQMVNLEKQIIHDSEAQRVDLIKALRRIERMSHPDLSTAPFHYRLRSGTYGASCDEPPYTVSFGIRYGRKAARSGLDEAAKKNHYSPRTLCGNWHEERRNTSYVRAAIPKLSEYGHYFETTYDKSYGDKLFFDRTQAAARRIQHANNPVFPGQQIESRTDLLLNTFPDSSNEYIQREQLYNARKKDIRDRYMEEVQRREQLPSSYWSGSYEPNQPIRTFTFQPGSYPPDSEVIHVKGSDCHDYSR